MSELERTRRETVNLLVRNAAGRVLMDSQHGPYFGEPSMALAGVVHFDQDAAQHVIERLVEQNADEGPFSTVPVSDYKWALLEQFASFEQGQRVVFNSLDRGGPRDALATILRPLTKDEAVIDEVGPMYKIRLADGTERDAYLFELVCLPKDAAVALPDGFNGHTMKFFIEPIEVSGAMVKLRCAEPDKHHMFTWREKSVVEAAAASQNVAGRPPNQQLSGDTLRWLVSQAKELKALKMERKDYSPEVLKAWDEQLAEIERNVDEVADLRSALSEVRQCLDGLGGAITRESVDGDNVDYVARARYIAEVALGDRDAFPEAPETTDLGPSPSA